MATRSAPSRGVQPPRSAKQQPFNEENHLEAAASTLARDVASLKTVVGALELEAGKSAAEAASCRELARAAEAAAAARSALNSELRGKLVSLAQEAAKDAELLASAKIDSSRVAEELSSAARKVALAEHAAASAQAHAQEMERNAQQAHHEAAERAREAEEEKNKAVAALAREKAANGRAAALEKRLADDRRAFQESMALFGAGGQFGAIAKHGWGGK